MIEGIMKKATGGLDGIVDDLLKSAKGKVHEKISEAFAIGKLESFKSNVSRIGQVKTILNPDSIVSLNNIFLMKLFSLMAKKLNLSTSLVKNMF